MLLLSMIVKNTLLPFGLYLMEESGVLKLMAGDDADANMNTTDSGPSGKDLLLQHFGSIQAKFGVMVLEMTILSAMGWNAMRGDTKTLQSTKVKRNDKTKQN